MWELIEALAFPDQYAITVKNGELYIAELSALRANGVRVKG